MPVGQQLPQFRARLPSGKRDMQCIEGFLRRLRALAARACARLHDTPSAMARSSSCRSYLKLSSMTSRSRGFSPAKMESIRLLSSASAWSPSTWATRSGGWLTTRNGMVASVGRLTRLNDVVASSASRGPSPSPPSARNCTVESDASWAPSPKPLSAANCTVESDGPRAPSPKPLSAANCTVESDTPPGPITQRTELHRRIGRPTGPLAQAAQRSELHRRIRRRTGPLGQPTHRTQLHRRIRHRTGPHHPVRPPGRSPRRGPLTWAGSGVGIHYGPERTAMDAAWQARAGC